ncbi:hypothetical protein Vi05172_g9814 [Venturia inaequalis]|nr:hypothetical protein Vi05172_g9814 [Venturia inaequalis]
MGGFETATTAGAVGRYPATLGLTWQPINQNLPVGDTYSIRGPVASNGRGNATTAGAGRRRNRLSQVNGRVPDTVANDELHATSQQPVHTEQVGNQGAGVSEIDPNPQLITSSQTGAAAPQSRHGGVVISLENEPDSDEDEMTSAP